MFACEVQSILWNRVTAGNFACDYGDLSANASVYVFRTTNQSI